MKVMLVVASPISTDEGFGTERIVTGLATRFHEYGVNTRVCGYGRAEQKVCSQVVSEDGVPIDILPTTAPYSRDEYFAQRTADAPGFQEVLSKFKPNIVQFHGVSPSYANIRHVEIAKQSGATTVLWHNVPGISCLQQGMLFKGMTPCDGEVRIRRCTYCRLRAFTRLPGIVAGASSVVGLGKLSPLLPQRFEALLGARRLTALHGRGLRTLFSNVDAIRVGAEWARTTLIANGYSAKKIFLIRPGVDLAGDSGKEADSKRIWLNAGIRRSLRLVFWGRIHRSKGIHTVFDALEQRPALNVEVALIGNLEGEDPYVVNIRQRASRDARVHTLGRLPHREILPVLRTADVALIPSRFFETGPITVFEARAAGLPILGSDRGGVAELCTGDESSWVFPAENSGYLARLMQQLVDDRSLVRSMKRSVKEPRTIENVAREVLSLYREISL